MDDDVHVAEIAGDVFGQLDRLGVGVGRSGREPIDGERRVG
ncbi:MAG: hypothetical protein R2710_21485 [Acidimicrobiales bacterium]